MAKVSLPRAWLFFMLSGIVGMVIGTAIASFFSSLAGLATAVGFVVASYVAWWVYEHLRAR